MSFFHKSHFKESVEVEKPIYYVALIILHKLIFWLIIGLVGILIFFAISKIDLRFSFNITEMIFELTWT